MHRTVAYDFKTPNWRLGHEDGDWEELSRLKVENSKESRGDKDNGWPGSAPSVGAGDIPHKRAGELTALDVQDLAAILVGFG